MSCRPRSSLRSSAGATASATSRTPARLLNLASCRRALREGGRLLLDSATVAELILPRLNRRLDLDLGEVRMSGRQSYDVRGGRLVGELEFSAPDEARETGTVVHHVYTTAELVRLLTQAGFEGNRTSRRPRRTQPVRTRIEQTGGGRASDPGALGERDCNGEGGLGAVVSWRP